MDSDWDCGFDSDSDYEEVWSVLITRRQKIIRSRPYYFQSYDAKDFRDRFRLSKEVAWEVLELIRPQIQHKSLRNNALIPENMLLIALRFYATGCMLQMCGDVFGVSKATISRVVTVVSHNIAILRKQFIDFPKTSDEIKKIQSNFFNRAKFPLVIAAIDCTHVKITSPGGADAELFRNRKGFISINVQTLCDSDLRLLDIVARWPGSAHDATIFRNSRICYRLESGEFGNGIVVADGGYEHTNYILTPLCQTNTPAENLFNESLIRTRNCVERSYGVWKRRFPVLSLGIRLHFRKIQSIIIATGVLHNICCLRNDKIAPPLTREVNEAVNAVLAVPNNREVGNRNGNNNLRRSLIDFYFAKM